ncbi:hydroxyacylglutathione hydrolase [Dongshaea marina]|uniref:hydroxyacylglutathione hydrolase n=1 Tax=Dongshaea marina TaxID=2047966 RepID=UPI000D3E5FF8|nr:hydroxyacylglutathione hydrolase [Dongshaea marina]
MANVSFIPAFHDNYIWLITHPHASIAAVVDPGDADVVIERLEEQDLQLGMILLTHHHQDHSGGVVKLLKQYPDAKLFASSQSELPVPVHYPLDEGDVIHLEDLELHLKVMAVPGHTLDHLAFYDDNILFCGDTLFSGGCGRLFEGSASQMFQALERFAKLGDATKIYCAHEYTLANLSFCSQVEPDNPELLNYIQQVAKKRQQGLPTLPSTIGQEKAVNVFLRTHLPEIRQRAEQHQMQPLPEPCAVFAALRQWKDRF